MYFRKSGLRKTWLHKCLKSALSLYASTNKMVNVPKKSSNLNDGSFAIVFYHCESN